MGFIQSFLLSYNLLCCQHCVGILKSLFSAYCTGLGMGKSDEVPSIHNIHAQAHAHAHTHTHTHTLKHKGMLE